MFFLFSKNKRKTLISGNNYGLKNLINISQKKNKIFITIGNSKNFAFIENLLNIFQLFNLFEKKIILFFILQKIKKKINLKNLSLNIKNNHKIFNLIFKDLLNYFENIASYLESIHQSTKNIINKSSAKITISHQFRMYEPTLIGMISKENNIKNILISHGSHVLSNKSIDQEPLYIQAKDILFSEFSSINIPQSPMAYEFLKKYQPEARIEPYKPIIWGYKSISNKSDSYFDQKKIKLLHASTSKQLCLRPYIYETAFEYIEGIKILCNKVNQFSNLELIIKVRETKDYSIDTLKTLIDTGQNCKIVHSGEFIDYLHQCDYLISFSSTTIEEALNYLKPVILYGYLDKYNFLPEEKNIIYRSSTKNIGNLLKKYQMNILF